MWMILFAAAIYADADAFEPKVMAGPFPSLEVCAAVAAIGISDLNTKHPDKDFRVECSTQKELKRHPDSPLYDLRDVAALAGAPFPAEKQ